MVMEPSEEQGTPNHAEPVADVRLSVGSDPSQYGGSVGSDPSQFGGSVGSDPSQFGEISENVVNEPYYRPLLRAAFRGDWEFAKRFFEQDDTSRTAKITSRSETLLHIAALSGQDEFLVNLVELLSPYPEALEMVDRDDRTALHNAVQGGRIRMVKALVRSNPRLTQLRDANGVAPFGIAANEASMHKEIAWFLAKSMTGNEASHPSSDPFGIDAIINLTYAGHHDITLYLVGRYPHLLTMKSTTCCGRSILDVLATMESHFHSGSRLSDLEALLYKCIPVNLSYKTTDKNSEPGGYAFLLFEHYLRICHALQGFSRSLWSAAKIVVPIIKRVHEVKLRNMAAVELAKQVCIEISYMHNTEITEFFRDGDLLYQATAKGISEIVKLCIQFFPELIRIRPHGASLPAHAVKYRQARTLRLFLQLSSTAEMSLVLGPTDTDFKDIMVAAASYLPNDDNLNKVAGATFQLQREFQWYKVVESCVIPSWRNANINTAKDVKMTCWNSFMKNHQELLEKGEKWVKDTANSCMLVSTLIATVLFAAAFTVPGGNDDKTGVPLLLGKDTFLVFAISDVLGLFSSVTAILLFLAVLTSRYGLYDFFKALHEKIIMGLCFLFLSLALMLVAFAASLTLMLEERVEWVVIPITLLASLPVVLFVIQQLPLLYQMVISTYGPSIFCPDGIWDGVDYTK